MLDGSEKYPEHKDILTVAKAQSRISRTPYPQLGVPTLSQGAQNSVQSPNSPPRESFDSPN